MARVTVFRDGVEASDAEVLEIDEWVCPHCAVRLRLREVEVHVLSGCDGRAPCLSCRLEIVIADALMREQARLHGLRGEMCR